MANPLMIDNFLFGELKLEHPHDRDCPPERRKITEKLRLALIEVLDNIPTPDQDRMVAALEQNVMQQLSTLCKADELDEKEASYWIEFLSIVNQLNPKGAVNILLEAVNDFPKRPHISIKVKQRMASTLMDLSSDLPYKFWSTLLDQDDPSHREKDHPPYAGAAFNGLSKVDPLRAIEELTRIQPCSKGLANALATIIDLTYEDLDKERKSIYKSKLAEKAPECDAVLGQVIGELLKELSS